MPGNEAEDKLYNFFEQEHLSQGSKNSQVASANWPVVSNNLWVGNHRQIGSALNSDTQNYIIQQSDPERGKDQQSPQKFFHTNNAQLTVRSEVVKSQFRNQDLSLNSSIYGDQGFQGRQKDTEFLKVKEVPNQHNLTPRGLPINEQQRGNAPEHSPALARTSEGLETAKAPVKLFSLDRQHQFMNNQQPGMSQPRPRQQAEFSDMQLWQQQQFMFKQLQELQRQRQLHQLEQEGRQQNQINHLSAFAKQAANDQLPTIVNGMPIHGSANYAWQNERSGGDPRLPNSSQMFMGNASWAQRGGYSAVQGIPDGLLSNEQGQMLRSMGLISQQLDQSVYGTHNANTRGAFNQYSHLQGSPQDCADTLNKASGNRLEKPIMQSSPLTNSSHGGQSALFPNQVSMHDGSSLPKQGFQGKNVFGHIPFQGMSSGVQPGNCMQGNSVSVNAPMHEFQGSGEQAGWSGNLQERVSSQVGPSQGIVTLDPTEKKILFSSDDDMWDAPGGKGGTIASGGYGNPLETVDHLNVFPSIQSGTWSALMQSAVAETSSSDTGLQDEWSGLSFNKREASTVDEPLALGDSAKQQRNWADGNLQGPSLTSRPFPLFDDGKMSQIAPDYQQSGAKTLHDQGERMQHDASYESIQQSLNNSGKWLNHSPQQQTLVHGNHQVQPSMNSENAWARQIQSESAAHTTNMTSDAHNMQGARVRQHGISSHNNNNQHGNNATGWSNANNNSLSASGDATLRISESENSEHRFQRNDLKMGVVERDHDGGLMMTNPFPSFTDDGGSQNGKRNASLANNSTKFPNSSTTKVIQETNQQVLSSHQLNNRKHMVGSPVNSRDDGMGYNQNPLGSQVIEASIYSSDRGSGETYDKKRESYQKEFSNDSYNSNQSQPTVTGGGFRENSWLSTSDSRPMASGNPKSGGQVARKALAPRVFQYHPMGSMEVDLEATDSSKRVANMQPLSRQAFQESKGHEREYFGHPEFYSRVSNNTIAMEKEHIPDHPGTEKGSASSDGSAGTHPQSRRTVQTCQNMLELFHNVDQSMEHGSDHNTSSVMPEAESSDASGARQWHNQSTASQGFGLRLAPPSKEMPVTNHVLNSQNSSQIVNSLSSRQVNSRIEEKNQILLAPASSVQSLPHEISQRERWEVSSNMSGTAGNETSQLNVQARLPAAFTSSVPYSRNQLQSQQLSRMSEKFTNNPPVNVLNNRHASQFRQTHGTYGEVVADQSSQVSLNGTTSRNSFVASPSENASRTESSSRSQVRVSGQQFPVLESVPVSRPSAMSGKSPHGDFSTMLHQAWASASQQHLTGGSRSKAPPNISQPSSPSKSNMERTSFGAQQVEHGDAQKGGNGPDFGTCSTNSQGFAYGEEQIGKESSWKQIPTEKFDPTPQRTGAFLGKESVMQHEQDENSIASAPQFTHRHQQDVDRGRYGKDPALVSQRENLPFRNTATSTRDIEAFGRSLRHTNHSYSLLHQVQAMKTVENELDKRGGKRFKRADGDADSQQLPNRAGQQLLDGSNAIVRDSSSPNAAVQHASFSSVDGKMLSFSTERREDQKLNSPSQNVHGVAPSQDMATSGRNDSHNRSSQLNVSSIRSESPQINPNMAPTWFDRYGTFRPEQILSMQDAQSTVKPVHQISFEKVPEGLNTDCSKEQVDGVDASLISNVCQSTVSTAVHGENLTHLQSLPLEVTDQTAVVMRPKKRKTETSVLMPWHKEIMFGSQRLQSISVAEQDWAKAANRLVEKMEEEAELADDAQPMIRPRRRLILTTQLMQQLLRPAPAEILAAKVTSDYEAVTYSVAKSALGEACSLISTSESGSYPPTVNENRESGKLKTSERVRDKYVSKVVEDFIGRAKKLETDLLRVDKRASVMDIRVECQDLERFSVINRFAKFHGKSQSDAAETSSSSAAAAMTQKTCPQRYVTAQAMPRNVPGGVQCLSL